MKMALLSIQLLPQVCSHDRGECEVLQTISSSKLQSTWSEADQHKFSLETPWQSLWVLWKTCFSNSCSSKKICSNLATASNYSIRWMKWSASQTNSEFYGKTQWAAAFLKSVDCTDHMAEEGTKDAAYIACNVISVVNEFGAEENVQVIIDDANKATWPIIIKEFPWIGMWYMLLTFCSEMWARWHSSRIFGRKAKWWYFGSGDIRREQQSSAS